MSSTQRGYAQITSKTLVSTAAVKLFTLAQVVGELDVAVEVSPTNYSATQTNVLYAAAQLNGLTPSAVLSANETLRDMGKTLTVTASDTGAQLVLQLVQRTKANATGGQVGYVVVKNDVSTVFVIATRS